MGVLRGFVAAIISLLLGCTAGPVPERARTAPAPERARTAPAPAAAAPTLSVVYGDDRTVALVRSAAVVKVGQVTAGAEDAARLSAALTDPACVRLEPASKTCGKSPQAVVRFEDPALGPPVEVFLCFSCERLTASRDGGKVSLGRSAPFDAPRLLEAVRWVVGPTDPSLEALSVFADERNRRVYREATALEVHRIEAEDGLTLRGCGYPRPVRGADPSSAELRFGARVGTSFEVTRNLTYVLLEPGNLRGPVAKGCAFKPGVLVRAWDDPDAVDVVLCFECNDLVVYRAGRPVGESDFAPGRKSLVAAVKAALPDDPAIRSLR